MCFVGIRHWQYIQFSSHNCLLSILPFIFYYLYARYFFIWLWCSGINLCLKMSKVRSERASSELWKVWNYSLINDITFIAVPYLMPDILSLIVLLMPHILRERTCICMIKYRYVSAWVCMHIHLHIFVMVLNPLIFIIGFIANGNILLLAGCRFNCCFCCLFYFKCLCRSFD